jgi:hypothetical protein
VFIVGFLILDTREIGVSTDASDVFGKVVLFFFNVDCNNPVGDFGGLFGERTVNLVYVVPRLTVVVNGVDVSCVGSVVCFVVVDVGFLLSSSSRSYTGNTVYKFVLFVGTVWISCFC